MKIIEKNYDVVTGEETITERDETAAETKARLDNAKAIAAAQTAAETKAIARQAVLDKLGLTTEEIAALLS
jgi:hypothetical protein